MLLPDQLVDVDTTETYLTTLIKMYQELNRGLDRAVLNRAVSMIDHADCVYYFGTCDIARRFQQDLCFNGKYVEASRPFSRCT